MAVIVLDSFALLAYLRGERRAEAVSQLLRGAHQQAHRLHMSEVNYAELKYTIMQKDGSERWEEIAIFFPLLPVSFHPASRQAADSAATIKSRHKLSLADAFAAALALELNAEFLTGDPEFKALESQIRIRWL